MARAKELITKAEGVSVSQTARRVTSTRIRRVFAILARFGLDDPSYGLILRLSADGEFRTEIIPALSTTDRFSGSIIGLEPGRQRPFRAGSDRLTGRRLATRARKKSTRKSHNIRCETAIRYTTAAYRRVGAPEYQSGARGVPNQMIASVWSLWFIERYGADLPSILLDCHDWRRIVPDLGSVDSGER